MVSAKVGRSVTSKVDEERRTEGSWPYSSLTSRVQSSVALFVCKAIERGGQYKFRRTALRGLYVGG